MTAPVPNAGTAACRAVSRGIPWINPVTGLSTDYLNHFSEALMTLDMVATCPEAVEDFLQWQPRSYREHFACSGFADRGRVIAAYENADPEVRRSLDTLAQIMNTLLLATREALRAQGLSSQMQAVVGETVASMRPLVCRAASMINATAPTLYMANNETQAAVDALFTR